MVRLDALWRPARSGPLCGRAPLLWVVSSVKALSWDLQPWGALRLLEMLPEVGSARWSCGLKWAMPAWTTRPLGPPDRSGGPGAAPPGGLAGAAAGGRPPRGPRGGGLW